MRPEQRQLRHPQGRPPKLAGDRRHGDAYDPMGGSYAFSLLGYSGTHRRLASAAPKRPAGTIRSSTSISMDRPMSLACTRSGGQDTPSWRAATAAMLASPGKASRLTAYYTKENGAVSLGNSVPATASLVRQCDAGILRRMRLKVPSQRRSLDIMAKYTMEFGGGFKDEGPCFKADVLRRLSARRSDNPDHAQSLL